jgi:hypothetical protein
VAVAVDAHLVTGRHDLGRQSRPLLDLLADEEEGRRRPRALERGEDGGRTLRMWAVVEGESDGVFSIAARTPRSRRSGPAPTAAAGTQ